MPMDPLKLTAEQSLLHYPAAEPTQFDYDDNATPNGENVVLFVDNGQGQGDPVAILQLKPQRGKCSCEQW